MWDNKERRKYFRRQERTTVTQIKETSKMQLQDLLGLTEQQKHELAANKHHPQYQMLRLAEMQTKVVVKGEGTSEQSNQQ